MSKVVVTDGRFPSLERERPVADRFSADFSSHIIGTQALDAALADGRVAGAGLDVFESEPLAAESPLRRHPNVILTPHAAFYSDASIDNLQRLAAEEAARALAGEPLRCRLG